MAKSKFLTEVREFMRLHGYSIRTEHTYIYWIRFYIRFHRLQHPSTLGPEHVVMFLSFLANRRDVAINTQKVALNALAFLYNKYLNQPLGDIGFTFATRPPAPTYCAVLSRSGEIARRVQCARPLNFFSTVWIRATYH